MDCRVRHARTAVVPREQSASGAGYGALGRPQVTIRQLVILAFALLLFSSCARPGRTTVPGESVDLVEKWGWGKPSSVVMTDARSRGRQVVSGRTDMGGFLNDLRNAIHGPQMEFTVVGHCEVEFEDGARCRMLVLFDSGRRGYGEKLVVQRMLSTGVDELYHMPDHFLKEWKRRFGPPR